MLWLSSGNMALCRCVAVLLCRNDGACWRVLAPTILSTSMKPICETTAHIVYDMHTIVWSYNWPQIQHDEISAKPYAPNVGLCA